MNTTTLNVGLKRLQLEPQSLHPLVTSLLLIYTQISTLIPFKKGCPKSVIASKTSHRFIFIRKGDYLQ